MPVLDGVSATRRLRAMASCQNVPIIALTANAFIEDREACMEAGMNDFIIKPVKPEVFYTTLRRWLPLKAATCPSTSSVQANLVAPVKTIALPDFPGLDTVSGLTNLYGNREKYLSLLERFSSLNAGMGDKFREHLLSGDLDALRTESHSLKSSAATLGALLIAEAAKEIELKIRSVGDQLEAAELVGLIDTLDDCLNSFFEGLKDIKKRITTK